MFRGTWSWKAETAVCPGWKLTGFILIGQTERAGIYTSLIREQTPLNQVDFEMLKTIASSAAFTQNVRQKKFSLPV